MKYPELPHILVKTLSKQFDETAILVNEREKSMVKLWNSEPSVVQSWIETEISIRLAKSKRLWILQFDTRDPLYIIKNAENVVNMVSKIEESELYTPLPEPSKCTPVEGAYDPNILSYMNDPSKPVEEMINNAYSYNVDRVAGTLLLSKTTRTLVTSKGYECTEEKTGVEAYIRAFKGEFSGHWAHGSTRLSLDEIGKVGQRAGYYATVTNNKVDIAPGTYDIVISPLVAGNLLDYIGFMASAFQVMLGFSFFSKYKTGDKVAVESFSLYDKPRDKFLSRASGFDDEGIETFDKPIIERGVLMNLLHNNATASKMDTKSTGNAGWIAPHPWNLEVTSGNIKEEDLVSELKNGIVITNNWYTRLQNYYEGFFSTVSRDATLLVKNGEIIGHVGRVRIASSFPRLLNSIIDASRDRFDIEWWEVRTPTRTPYLLLGNILITKPEA